MFSLKNNRRSPYLVLFLYWAVLATGCASSLDFFANRFFLPNEGIREASYAVKTQRHVVFTTSDGIQLNADVHSPQDLEKTPTLLVRIPFTDTLGNRIRSDVIARYWASRGYTVVIQGTRGRYGSTGKFYPLIHEREDGIETLQWLAKQPWYDKRLAMWGGSSFGHTQWAISDQTDPGPDVLFIQIASTSFREMFYPGNAFSLESALYWTIRSRGEEDREVDMDDLKKGVAGLPIIEADDHAIGDTDFFNDWVSHPEKDDYWRTIDGDRRPQHLEAPTLLMAGWFDPFLPTQIADYLAITHQGKPQVAAHSKLIIGPWGHADSAKIPGLKDPPPYRAASIAPSIPWFDHHLGLTDAPLNMPRVNIFVMGANRWRSENEWPLARTRYTAFYLHSQGRANSVNGDGQLDTVLPGGNEQPDVYLYDPLNPVPSAGGAMLSYRSGPKLQNAIESRADVLVYSTPPLTDAVEVTGPVEAVLYVATGARSTDFTAKLVDVHPDGSAYNLCDGILRRGYQESNVDREVEPVQIRIQLWPTSNVFKQGHRIRLEVSSSNFPRYDRNPNTGETIATATHTIPAYQKVFHNTRYPSRLILPVIPKP